MDRTISVRTPESIQFSYELAGLGSRFLAVVLDLMIQLAIVIAIFWSLALIGSHAPHGSLSASGKLATAMLTATVITIVFIVFFGYFVILEWAWNGQTPGKKALGIRVVRDGGYPIDLGSSLIRNLIRVGEAAAGFYALSAASTLLSAENKRLGDIAAGTIVVRDARTVSARELARAHGATAADFPLLNDDERALVARFCARRDGMAPQYRAQMASQIANVLRPRLSRDLQLLDDDDLMTRLNGS
ncbi:MAG: RDD family protein [Vulcanimicrobiaceae bacterium]